MLKTAIYAILTLMISVGGFIAARANSSNPWPGFAIAFGVVIWFFWGLNRRWKKEDERKIMERIFIEKMRGRQHHKP